MERLKKAAATTVSEQTALDPLPCFVMTILEQMTKKKERLGDLKFPKRNSSADLLAVLGLPEILGNAVASVAATAVGQAAVRARPRAGARSTCVAQDCRDAFPDRRTTAATIAGTRSGAEWIPYVSARKVG